MKKLILLSLTFFLGGVWFAPTRAIDTSITQVFPSEDRYLLTDDGYFVYVQGGCDELAEVKLSFILYKMNMFVSQNGQYGGPVDSKYYLGLKNDVISIQPCNDQGSMLKKSILDYLQSLLEIKKREEELGKQLLIEPERNSYWPDYARR